jgi:soluble lytic murein transglycosylase-like protein
VLSPDPKKELTKPLALIPFLRPKATPTPLPEERELEMSYEAMFQEIASQHGLDWRVLEAVAYHESRMNYLALGQASDMGLMQVIPSTWNQWAPKVGVYDPYDPYSNISVGAAYLAYVRDFCAQRGHTEPHWMLVAYNWGPQRVGDLFARGGRWEEVPAPQRRYALGILEMASNRAAGLATVEEFYPVGAFGKRRVSGN